MQLYPTTHTNFIYIKQLHKNFIASKFNLFYINY
jgi:hypothetical protein